MAVNTNSPLLKLLLMGTGNEDNAWGENLNEFVLKLTEQAIAGLGTVNMTGGSITLTEDQRRQAVLDLTGSLASDETITVENLSKMWWVRNSATLNGHEVNFKTTSGASVTIPAGNTLVMCDGFDNITVFGSGSTQLRAPVGSEALPGLSLDADFDSGFWSPSDDNVHMAIGGNDIIEFSAALTKILNGLTVEGTLDLPDASITYAMLQDVTQGKLLGRGNGDGDGEVEEMTLSEIGEELIAAADTAAIQSILDLEPAIDIEKMGSFAGVVQVTASRDLAASDMGKLLYSTSGSEITLTVRKNSDVNIANGKWVVLARMGTGDFGIAESANMDIMSISDNKRISDQGGTMTLTQVTTDQWLAAGSLKL